MAMYIRVKRNKTTYFVQCDPTETTLNIKQKLQNLIDQPSNNQRLSLVATNDILDDSKTLAEQKVENDAVVALALRKAYWMEGQHLSKNENMLVNTVFSCAAPDNSEGTSRDSNLL
ncbi:uncharacterized protein LOC103720445 isoform X2 [Phoenix dactylifera]|uniref:Uncharacterized protein LOC103720445 isoform X2 n=1 Tax=Phoenix dactylifera TaxID=42345 RepID=A0A8B7CXN9_PHODC|nr:uncharacterized protein LOC103720445 isoform X2 [Phoenix dactylifera]